MACGRSTSITFKKFPAPSAMGFVGYEFRSTPWKHTMCGLYRHILKLHHAKLKPVQKELGDRFVQAEFKRHAVANEKYSLGPPGPVVKLLRRSHRRRPVGVVQMVSCRLPQLVLVLGVETVPEVPEERCSRRVARNSIRLSLLFTSFNCRFPSEKK